MPTLRLVHSRPAPASPQVDGCRAGGHRHAQARGRVQQRLGADLQGQLGEVGVAGVDQAIVHVDRAVRVPVQDVVADGASSRNAHADAAARQAAARELGLSQPQIAPECRRGGDQLERRSRGIQAEARPIEERVCADCSAPGGPSSGNAGHGWLNRARTSPEAASSTTADALPVFDRPAYAARIEATWCCSRASIVKRTSRSRSRMAATSA